jgi:DNA-binding response OmpR family regulator
VDRPSVLFVVAHRTLEQRFRPSLEQRYDVAVARARNKALQMIEEAPPTLILMDVPSVRFAVGRFFQSLADLPVRVTSFLLLGKGMRLDQMPRVNGYLRHPFTPRQLMHRLSRVVPDRSPETVEWRGLCLDIENRLLIWQGQQILLTPKQTSLALIFLKSPCTIVSRELLMHDIWGTDYMGDTRTLDVHVHWFRKALAQSHAPFVLETERGKGYRMVSSALDS